jgi:predicted DNA-binding transcriptional regulator YafY
VRASRLLSLLMVLQARGRVTADALAVEFEVSVRTIYRDVDELSAAGVPVFADRGPGGGFQLREGFRTHLTGLTSDEAEILLFTGLAGPVADLGFGSAMASAERKLLAALPAAQSARAAQARQRVLLDPLNWYRRVERPKFLPELTRAVWNQTRIAIRYESWTTTNAKTIEPFGLVNKAGTWYVVARRAETLRTYKIGQILALTELDEHFEIPVAFSLANHWSSELSRFEKQLRRGHATIRVAPAALSRIDWLGADAAEAVRAGTPDDTGWRVVEIPIEKIDHAAVELLAFGPDVKVLEPPELATRLRDLACQVADHYRSTDTTIKLLRPHAGPQKI